MINPYISQLEEEIKKDFPLPLVRETYELSLQFNNYFKNTAKQQQDKNYIKKLYKEYLLK